MHRRAFTLIEILLVIILLGMIVAFAFPDLGAEAGRRSLTESADRLRSLIVMAHSQAMQDGVRYRIQFPGTPDPLDVASGKAEKEVDIPFQTLQPTIQRQVDPMSNPEAFGDFNALWKDPNPLQDGTRCVAVRPGKPNVEECTGQSVIAGPPLTKDRAEFVPLTLNPDGTAADYVTFVLTDLPIDVELGPEHVGHIFNLIVDKRTGQAWIQRALLCDEVELLHEKNASPILHMDFLSPDLITEANILEIHVQTGRGAQTSGGGAR